MDLIFRDIRSWLCTNDYIELNLKGSVEMPWSGGGVSNARLD